MPPNGHLMALSIPIFKGIYTISVSMLVNGKTLCPILFLSPHQTLFPYFLFPYAGSVSL
jgi:hypothetical protein